MSKNKSDLLLVITSHYHIVLYVPKVKVNGRYLILYIICMLLLLFSVVPLAPKLSVRPSNGIPVNTTDVTLICESSVQSVSNFTFFKNRSLIYNGVNNTFTFPTVGLNDTGVYSCQITIDGINSQQSKLILTVYSKFYHVKRKLCLFFFTSGA